MQKNLIFLAIVVVVIAAIAIIYANKGPEISTSPLPTSSSTPIEVSPSIIIEGFSYHPVKLVIKKGTTVKWTNLDSVRHDVKSDTGSELAGPLLKQSESFEHTFNTVGTFPYHCTPHPFMKATIEVMEDVSD